MRRYKVEIRFKSGFTVTVSHESLFVEVDIRNDYYSGYMTEEDLLIGKERVIAKQNTVSVRVGIRGESRSLIRVQDAAVNYDATDSLKGKTIHVTRGVITDGSIPLAFGLDFDSIVFSESHEERTP